MSGYGKDDVLLENNIIKKEFELIHLLQESVSSGLQGRIFYQAHYKLNYNFQWEQVISQLPSVIQSNPFVYEGAPIKKLNDYPHNQLFENQWINLNNRIPEVQHNIGQNINEIDIFANNNPINEIPGYPINRSQPVFKRVKINKRKNYQSKSASLAAIDLTNIVVNLHEIGLGPQIAKKFDATYLGMKFHRFYIYITALCKERKFLESIILCTEIKQHEKYNLSINTTITRHLDYTQDILMVEINFTETILNNIKDDAVVKFCKEFVCNIISLMKQMNEYKNCNLTMNIVNPDIICKLDTIVSQLTANVRFVSSFYTVVAEKLLAKETPTHELLHKMFVGC